MIVNDRKKLEPADGEDDPEGYDEYWYYFGSKGKKTGDGTATDKKIGGKYYYFDETGKMRDGWYDDGTNKFYFGEENDGARASGWLWLDNWENDDDINNNAGCALSSACEDEGWYYFNTSSGKMTKGESRKKINGKYYYFNADGQMLYQWIDNSATAPIADHDPASGSTVTINNMRYVNEVEEGWEGGGWYQIDGSSVIGEDGVTDWYYFKDGEAKTAKATNIVVDDLGSAVAATRAKLKISGKNFCFNDKGQMMTGLQKIGSGFYYFDENGYMKTGKVSSVEEDDDNTYTYYFNTSNGSNGAGFTGPKSGYLYWNGKRLEADDDYKIYNVNNLFYIVNNSGKIQKTVFKTYSIENSNTLGGELKGGSAADSANGIFKLDFTKDGALKSAEASVIMGAVTEALPEITLYDLVSDGPVATWTQDLTGNTICY